MKKIGEKGISLRSPRQSEPPAGSRGLQPRKRCRVRGSWRIPATGPAGWPAQGPAGCQPVLGAEGCPGRSAGCSGHGRPECFMYVYICLYMFVHRCTYRYRMVQVYAYVDIVTHSYINFVFSYVKMPPAIIQVFGCEHASSGQKRRVRNRSVKRLPAKYRAVLAGSESRGGTLGIQLCWPLRGSFGSNIPLPGWIHG